MLELVSMQCRIPLTHPTYCKNLDICTNVFLLTNILHSETVVLVEICDVVLAAELHAVGDPNRCMVSIEEALPI